MALAFLHSRYLRALAIHDACGLSYNLKVQRRFIINTATALSVPVGISRRIERLAREAGRTPLQMLKFVIRDGLEHTEYAVREANAGLAELDAGMGIPLDQVRKRVEIRQHQRARSTR